jgi:hypothetical protein
MCGDAMETLPKDEVLFFIDGQSISAKGLAELGKCLEDVESISIVSHDVRRVIENEFPQHVHKLPPKSLGD